MKFWSEEARNSRSCSRHLGEILAAWWRVCDVNELNLSMAARLNHSTLLFSSFWIVFSVVMTLCANLETRGCQWFKLSAKLWLSALTSHNGHQAARSSPRWRPPDLEFLANLEKNFIGLESSSKVGSSVSNLALYNLSVGKKKILPFWNEHLP